MIGAPPEAADLLAMAPSATYRLQLHAGFTLHDAREAAPHIAALGASHLYLSPIFKARSGSMHGYDVVDPRVVNPALGGEEALVELASTAKRLGLRILLDIVPNHMAASEEGEPWRSVLEHGPASPFAPWFDIRWRASASDAESDRPRLLLPMLGKSLEDTLAEGAFGLGANEYGPALTVHGRSLPLEPGTWGDALEGAGLAAREACAQLAALSRGLPSWLSSSEIEVRQRLDRSAKMRTMYSERIAADAEELARVDEALRSFSEREPESLRALLRRQPYQPCDWRDSSKMIAYRRFFDINDLAAVRVEDPAVFEQTHAKLAELARRGLIQGVRCDHIDGLAFPFVYLTRLRRLADEADRAGPEAQPLAIYVEKIVAEVESLPDDWPVLGTTGYEFTNALPFVFVDPCGLREISQEYSRLTGAPRGFEGVVVSQKRWVAEMSFGGELVELTGLLAELARREGEQEGLSESDIRSALVETAAHLPVYRTYASRTRVSEQDTRLTDLSIEAAMASLREEHARALPLLRRILLFEWPSRDAEEEILSLRDRFVQRWQQFTGPLAAKGFEDTALYRDARLLSLNEVGSEPRLWDDPGSPSDFHAFCRVRRETWPGSLSTVSTHDTKRSADVRARLHALSEMPEDWVAFAEALIERLPALREDGAADRLGNESPDPVDALFIAQTVLGAWPLDASQAGAFRERIGAYVQKAVREAGRHTTWVEPDEGYERGAMAFADRLIDLGEGRGGEKNLGERLVALRERVAFVGACNSLAQTLLQVAAPGVPDIYQGNELWDFSLVDPDNRRPVDFNAVRTALRGVPERASPGDLPGALSDWRSGRIKTLALRRALAARAADPELFLLGEYVPLAVTGERAEHIVAFLRSHEGRAALCVVPRLTHLLGKGERWPVGESVWGETEIDLPSDGPVTWRGAMDGERVLGACDSAGCVVRVAEALRHSPVQLLLSDDE